MLPSEVQKERARDRYLRLGLSGGQDPDPAQPGTDPKPTTPPQPGSGDPKPPGTPEPDPAQTGGSGTPPNPTDLIAESKKYRERAQKAEAALAKIEADRQAQEDAERTEVERAKASEQKAKEAVEQVRAELQMERNRTAIVNAAVELGARRPDVVFRLVDQEALEIEDGKVTNAPAVVKALLDSMPELMQASAGDPTATGAPPTKNGKTTLTLDQIKRMEAEGTLTPEFVRANSEAIEAAMASARK